MDAFIPSLYFRYLASLYLKNLFFILIGISLTFGLIDYFQHLNKLQLSANYQILYIFYMWQYALGLLYPLAIVFALIMTKISLIKNNTMGAFHAFGYSKQTLLMPILFIAMVVYLLFSLLHTTSFSYAKDNAKLLLENRVGAYDVKELFFKYEDTFVYVKNLEPLEKKIEGLTLFKVQGHQVRYTLHANLAYFNGKAWIAKDAILKRHIYKEDVLERYSVEKKESMTTLKGYKPKIIESFHEGKALNIIDSYFTWRLLASQGIHSEKIRTSFYDKMVVPLFSIALMSILFFKLPFHARMVNIGGVIALSLGVTFVVWGVLFGLIQIGANALVSPELSIFTPIVLLWCGAIYIYFTDEKSLA